MRVAGRLSPEEFWAHVAADEQRLRDSAGVLPVYRLTEWTGPVLVGDWGWENGELVTVGIAHEGHTADGPAVHVRTTTHLPRAEAASLRALAEAGDGIAGRRRPADLPPGEDVQILVESTPVTFELWRDGDRWWAATGHGGHGLVLEGRQVAVDRVALVRVTDIEPYLVVRRENLRARRDET